MNGVIRGAKELATAGWPVFPCRADKRPATPHGFKDAVCDPTAATDLWRRHPGPLIGVPTGEASDVDVLDIDPRHGGGNWWQTHKHLIPQTRIHRTRSGGLHALFQHAPGVRNTESKLGQGVDTRGEGGYIIWWPGEGHQVADAPIAAWPDWLLRELLRRLERERDQSKGFSALDNADHAQRVAQRVLAKVANASAGERYYVLRKAAYTIGGLLDMLPFGETAAIKRLVRAAEDAGAEDSKHAERIAKWGFEHGKEKKFELKGNP